MNMDDVITLVNTNRGKGKKKSLDRTHFLLNELGNPQNNLKVIHLAGTNGKGSTSSFIMSILRKAGYTVGLFTSPHLEKINERIRIDDTFISDTDFISLTEKVYPAVIKTEEKIGESLHAFEILTAVACLYFTAHPCDVVILEAGIGGRLDATNAISDSLVSVITSIGLDHVNVLGNTVEKIAVEKVAIVKEKGDLVTFDAPPSLKDIFVQQCKEKHASYHAVDGNSLKIISTSIDKQVFHYKNDSIFTIKMLGAHQVRNAALAIEVANVLKKKGFNISDEQIAEGLEDTFWPGRWEKISDSPLAFLDGAHNLPAVEVLVDTIATSFPGKKVTFILGMMADKDYKNMINAVLPHANKFLTLAPDSDRAVEGDKMTQMLQEKGYLAESLHSPQDVLHYIHHLAGKDEIIVIFGSLYLVGNIKEEMHKMMHTS